MKIYVDLIFFINFILDLLLLISVSLILRRNVRIIKLILGALIGSLTIFILFTNINSFTLFFIKVLISIIMILVSFGFKNVKYFINNLVYLYLISIVLAGALYFINNSFSYKNTGLIFINNGFSINLFLVIILSPTIIFMYIKNQRKQKEELSNYYEVTITFLNGLTKNLTGFLDTGNNLYDPYKKRPIIIINKDILGSYNPNFIMVPCLTVNKESLLKCFKIKKIVINGRNITKECLVGISDNNFNINGVDLLLHKKIITEDIK